MITADSLRKSGSGRVGVRPFGMVLILVVLLVAGSVGCCGAAPTEVYFSPRGGAEAALVRLIDGAAKEIDAAVYTFTNRALAAAVVRAHKRGVKIRLILDGNDESDYSKGFYLRQRGVDVRYARGLAKKSRKKKKKRYKMRKYGLMHHKFAVVDGKTVATGSFNWTASAERWNHENLLVIKSPSLARRYETVFQKIWKSTFRK